MDYDYCYLLIRSRFNKLKTEIGERMEMGIKPEVRRS